MTHFLLCTPSVVYLELFYFYFWSVQRRKEREEDEKESKRSKLTSYKDDEDGQSLDESPRRFEENNKKHENYKER